MDDKLPARAMGAAPLLIFLTVVATAAGRVVSPPLDLRLPVSPAVSQSPAPAALAPPLVAPALQSSLPSPAPALLPAAEVRPGESARALDPAIFSGLKDIAPRTEQEAPSDAADRVAALMDGSLTEGSGPPSIGYLQDLRSRETPVRIRWLDAESGEVRSALARISVVTDSLRLADMRKRTLVYTDAAAGEIELQDIRSVVPAGLSAQEYESLIRPEPPKSLEVLLARTGLPPGRIQAMRTNSRGFMTAQDFLRSPRPRNGIGLGVSDNLDQFDALARAAGLTRWQTLYDIWFGGFEHPRTEEFMPRATAKGRPVFMFLPSGVVDRELYPYTLSELEWLLARPERMKNVTFVVGAYEMFSKVNEARLSHLGALRGGDERRLRLLLDVYRRIQGVVE
jgi:hypothetical protein